MDSACAGMTADFVVPGKAGENLERCEDRSFHSGFISSISLIFHARFHFLSLFSLWIASYMSPCNSKYTSVCTP
jgi:hypothetical protein